MNALTNIFCPTCNKLLAIIPSEFSTTFRTPCKDCQGWEVQHNFDLYLLRFDKQRYEDYKKLVTTLI
jgi:hypothetical protein